MIDLCNDLRRPSLRLLLVALLASAAAAGCGDLECPCAAPPGIDFELHNDVVVANLGIGVYRDGATVASDASFHEVGMLEAGTYDLVFRLDGVEIGRLDGVCTPGPGPGGCDCDQPRPTAAIRISTDSVALLRQGC